MVTFVMGTPVEEDPPPGKFVRLMKSPVPLRQLRMRPVRGEYTPPHLRWDDNLFGFRLSFAYVYKPERSCLSITVTNYRSPGMGTTPSCCIIPRLSIRIRLSAIFPPDSRSITT